MGQTEKAIVSTMNISQRIAEELAVQRQQAEAAIQLLDEGATVPFIARYRKEKTGSLTDTQLRTLEERLNYLRELESRREAVLRSLGELDKLSPELAAAVASADTKQRLEDLYAPFKPKRRTKAQIAREAGLDALLDLILTQSTDTPEQLAQTFVNPDNGLADYAAALEGARYIFMERAVEDADLVGRLRELAWEKGVLRAAVVEEKRQVGAKFADYFDYSETIATIPSHRVLALMRGRNEGVLRVTLTVPGQDDVEPPALGLCEHHIGQPFSIRTQNRARENWLVESIRWAWRVRIQPQLETELFLRARESAETEAIRVFAANLRDLLLASPAGAKITLGLDPGLRTGVKIAVVDRTGKLLEHATIYPHAPKNAWHESLATLARLVQTHGVDLISIGNGTASRETEKLVRDLARQDPARVFQSVVVSEAGASVYSASELASKEFPDLDVTIRGAVSIARRLQDPLAELVKIEPRSIGVGQYQHDVNQNQLSRGLDAVVEDCVNAVGVDVNTASVSLLARVAGLSMTLAKNIVAYRDEFGAFHNRDELHKVARLGPKAFEQAAGFLRISDGHNPLDRSAVHPESYPVVERILKKIGKPAQELIGDLGLLGKLDPREFVNERFGEPTVRDILRELEKPGRDPRPLFRAAAFKEGVETLQDLVAGMLLEGVVTNVTNFGAFIDIGVHQDGLVHISALADKFVRDPREVVKTGEVVKVRVLEVDLPRKRIALTMRTQEPTAAAGKSSPKTQEKKNPQTTKAHPPMPSKSQTGPLNTAMADALAGLIKNRQKH